MDIDYKKYHRDEDYLANESLFRNIFLKRFKFIQKYAKRGRVLDIGCSNGVFLDLYRKKGWETWGVEPSKNAKVAGRKGHRVLNGFIEKVEIPKNHFDLVIMNHTLEHVGSPRKVLKKIYGLLNGKGVLFVDVPNAGGLSAKLMGRHWPYRAPLEHKWQFTRQSLEKVIKKAGFKIVHFESRSGIFEYANPLLELKRKRFLIDLIALPYSLIATLLNMGDSMSVIGKKV